MKVTALLLIVLLFTIRSGFAQDTSTLIVNVDSVHPVLQTSSRAFLLGADSILFSLTSNGGLIDSVAYINVHDDENTAAEAAMELLRQKGGTFVQLIHQGSRNLHFKFGTKRYTVDPNRIYTPAGRKATLTRFNSYDRFAAEAVKAFADTFLRNYIDGKKFVVALHNNTAGGLSIRSYTRGQPEAKNASRVFINPEMDVDDFVLTTKAAVFEHMKANGINTVLQSRRPVDDGSLSVYAAKNGIAYINVEAEHGRFEEQLYMLELLCAFIQNGSDRL